MKLVELQDNGCWLWLKSFTGEGYGQYRDGPECLAHRVFYKYFVSLDLPEQVMHRCNNKWCVNPEHLMAGNAKLNYEHAKICGLVPDKDQRFGRANTQWKKLPKGITYDKSRGDFKCSIRIKPFRYQCRKNTIEDAIAWRTAMESSLWNNQLIQQDNTND